MPRPRRSAISPAGAGGDGLGAPRAPRELRERALEVAAVLAEHRDRRRAQRHGGAQHQARLDDALPLVDLERERRVDRRRPARPAGAARRRTRRRAARPPPERTVKRACWSRRSPPKPTGSLNVAAASSSETGGLPAPNGASARSSSASASPSCSPEATASTRSRGTRSSGESARAGVRDERGAETPRALAGSIVSPAAARWPPWRSRCAPRGAQPGEQVERRDRAPRAARRAPPARSGSAMSTRGGGGGARSAPRRCRSTPGCQPCAASTYAGGRPLRGDRAPRPRSGSASRCRGARRWRGRARPRARRRGPRSSVSSSSSALSAR